MAITAALVSLAKRKNGEGVQIVRVIYADGVSFKITKEYALQSCTLQSLTALVRNEAMRIDNAPPVIDLSGISEGMVFDVKPVVVVPPEPTPEDQARAAFFTLWRLAQAQTRAIAYGLLDPNEQDVLQVAAMIKETFRSDYLEFM